MNRALAGVLTALIMGLVLWTGLKRSHTLTRSATASQPDPRMPDYRDQDPGTGNRASLHGAIDRIEDLLASVRNGDARSYLACFGGALRPRLEHEAGELGPDVFAARLKSAGQARYSHAVFAPEPDGDRQGALRITVESTFADRLERQTFLVEHEPGGWVITEVETPRERIPKYPLGSLAHFQQREGNPVAGAALQSVRAGNE
jgi:hypothetical protein